MISDISIQFCEYNRSNPDADRIYRPQGSGDYLFLLLKTPMKVYQENGILITGENACILYTPGRMQHYQAVQKFRNSYLHFVAQENPAEYFQLPQKKKGCTGIFRHFAWRCSAIMKNTGQPNNSAIR